MGIFGSGVGGGLLATMGAVKGLGEGIAEGGEMGVKQQMMDRQAQQQLDRERTIQDLQQKFQTGEAEKGRTFEQQQTTREIKGRAGVAQYQARQEDMRQLRELQEKAEQAGNHEAAANYRAKILGLSRVESSTVRADAGSKVPEWDKPIQKKIPLTGTDPTTGHAYLPGATNTVTLQPNNRLGLSFVQQGNKLVPWDDTKNAPMPPTGKVPTPAAIDNLNQHPETLPDFVQTFGHVPMSYLAKSRTNQFPASGSGSVTTRTPGDISAAGPPPTPTSTPPSPGDYDMTPAERAAISGDDDQE